MQSNFTLIIFFFVGWVERERNPPFSIFLVGFGGFCWVLLGFAGVLLGFWWVLVGFGGFWWLLVGFCVVLMIIMDLYV
jgi:hypothetical protein